MIVGGIEEVRLDEAARELYTADNYLGGRVMVFDLDTFKFKRGWGAYGHKLSEITTSDADRVYTAGGTMPKEFRGHLTLNFSNDGMVYAADRAANRIHVTTKDGKFVKEFVVAPTTAVPPPPDKPAVNTGKEGSAGGVGFSPDKEQRFLYISDLSNNTVWFLNRADGKVVGRLGSMGAERRAVLRSAHDRRRLQGRHLHRRSVQRRARAAVSCGALELVETFGQLDVGAPGIGQERDRDTEVGTLGVGIDLMPVGRIEGSAASAGVQLHPGARPLKTATLAGPSSRESPRDRRWSPRWDGPVRPRRMIKDSWKLDGFGVPTLRVCHPAPAQNFLLASTSRTSCTAPRRGLGHCRNDADLSTNFIKIVVTDDQRPLRRCRELPAANYNVWVGATVYVDSAQDATEPRGKAA